MFLGSKQGGFFLDEINICRIGDGELINKMKELVQGHEQITTVSAYKCKLVQAQLTQMVFNHQFVVYETDEWWWSVEKNSEGITIQRSKKLGFVKDRYATVWKFLKIVGKKSKTNFDF